MRDYYRSEKESRPLWKNIYICSRNSHKYILNTGEKNKNKRQNWGRV